MRGFKIWSQNWVWIIFDPRFGRKTIKMDQNCDFNDFFFARIGVKYYPNSILRSYLEFFYKGKSSSQPILERDWKFIPVIFSKKLIWCANRKSSFSWKKNAIVLIFTSHVTGLAPKTWKKFSSVKNETPYCPCGLAVKAVHEISVKIAANCKRSLRWCFRAVDVFLCLSICCVVQAEEGWVGKNAILLHLSWVRLC